MSAPRHTEEGGLWIACVIAAHRYGLNHEQLLAAVQVGLIRGRLIRYNRYRVHEGDVAAFTAATNRQAATGSQVQEPPQPRGAAAGHHRPIIDAVFEVVPVPEPQRRVAGPAHLAMSSALHQVRTDLQFIIDAVNQAHLGLSQAQYSRSWESVSSARAELAALQARLRELLKD